MPPFGEEKEERQKKLLKGLLVKLSISLSGTRRQSGRTDAYFRVNVYYSVYMVKKEK